MRKNRRSHFQHHLVTVPPSGPAPSKSTQLDLDRPNLAATQIALGKMEDRVAGSTDSAADTPANNSLQNGDEVGARMARIEEILGHAAMHLLEKCSLIAEWVRYAEAKLSVFGRIVPKPKGGRPEGGVARAARELPVPGKSPDARRKFIERALKVDGIGPRRSRPPVPKVSTTSSRTFSRLLASVRARRKLQRCTRSQRAR